MMVNACQHSESARNFDVQRFSKRFVLVCFALLVFSVLSYCQVDTAAISGVITDQSGAAVVGAEVHVTNTDTNATRTSISNGSSIYFVTGLKPGRYRVHVGREGFKGE